MIEQKTLAYINVNAVFRAMTKLCDLDSEANKLASTTKRQAMYFNVKDGPKATLTFHNGKCTYCLGKVKPTINLYLSSPQKLNKMVEGVAMPLPASIFTLFNLKFLTKNYIQLGDILASYLRAKPDKMTDNDFLVKRVNMMVTVIGSAICEIGNHDMLGKLSASRIPDGTISLGIKDGPTVSLVVKNHMFTFVDEVCKSPRAVMVFENYKIAQEVFDGQEDAMAAIGRGELTLKGFVPMLDNLNRILARVSAYLA